MRKMPVYLMIVMSVFCLGFLGCSKGGDVQSDDKAKVVREEPRNEQAEKIRETLRSPINKARSTQDLGDERTKAIDEALKNK
jgi:hypothetical protein